VSVQEETDLLTQAQAGDVAAFERFVRLFERRVRGLLSRLLSDERDIEEAAQDTFVQAWRNLSRFRGDAAPFTWLYRIAVNEALQRSRRRRLETQPIDEEVLDVLEYQHGRRVRVRAPPISSWRSARRKRSCWIGCGGCRSSFGRRSSCATSKAGRIRRWRTSSSYRFRRPRAASIVGE